jgi:hypothetical protein
MVAMMAHPLAIVAGILMHGGALGQNHFLPGKDRSDQKEVPGFLTKYMASGSDGSKSSMKGYDKFIIPTLQHVKHGNRPDALAGTSLFTIVDNKPILHPATQVRDSMAFTPARGGPSKIADREEKQAEQKVLGNYSMNPISFSAIGIGLLSLATMLGVRLRRGLQPAAILASSAGLGPDMPLNMSSALGDSVMEMKSQDSHVKYSAARVGWGQLSSQNSRPLGRIKQQAVSHSVALQILYPITRIKLRAVATDANPPSTVASVPEEDERWFRYYTSDGDVRDADTARKLKEALEQSQERSSSSDASYDDYKSWTQFTQIIVHFGTQDVQWRIELVPATQKSKVYDLVTEWSKDNLEIDIPSLEQDAGVKFSVFFGAKDDPESQPVESATTMGALWEKCKIWDEGNSCENTIHVYIDQENTPINIESIPIIVHEGDTENRIDGFPLSIDANVENLVTAAARSRLGLKLKTMDVSIYAVSKDDPEGSIVESKTAIRKMLEDSGSWEIGNECGFSIHVYVKEASDSTDETGGGLAYKTALAMHYGSRDVQWSTDTFLAEENAKVYDVVTDWSITELGLDLKQMRKYGAQVTIFTGGDMYSSEAHTVESGTTMNEIWEECNPWEESNDCENTLHVYIDGVDDDISAIPLIIHDGEKQKNLELAPLVLDAKVLDVVADVVQREDSDLFRRRMLPKNGKLSIFSGSEDFQTTIEKTTTVRELLGECQVSDEGNKCQHSVNLYLDEESSTEGDNEDIGGAFKVAIAMHYGSRDLQWLTGTGGSVPAEDNARVSDVVAEWAESVLDIDLKQMVAYGAKVSIYTGPKDSSEGHIVEPGSTLSDIWDECNPWEESNTCENTLHVYVDGVEDNVLPIPCVVHDGRKEKTFELASLVLDAKVLDLVADVVMNEDSDIDSNAMNDIKEGKLNKFSAYTGRKGESGVAAIEKTTTVRDLLDECRVTDEGNKCIHIVHLYLGEKQPKKRRLWKRILGRK